MNTSALNELNTITNLPELEQLNSALAPAGELFLVGGSVRDAILGLDTKTDFDLTIKLHPEQILALLSRSNIHVIPTGLKHQTVTAVFTESKLHVEITSFRAKGMTPAGGVVLGSTIEEDLGLRDFTINSLAYSFSTGRIIDPLNGQSDIEQKIIRASGDPAERYKEDPLRMLRAIRFAAVLGFDIENKTAEEIGNHSELLRSVSVERIRDEFEKILLSPRPQMGFEKLLEFGLLPLILPEIMPSVGCDQNRFHDDNVFTHTLKVVENTRSDLILRLSALFHDIGKPHTISIDEITGDRHFFKHETVGAEITKDALVRLKFSNEVAEATTQLVRTHMRPTDAGPPGLRRLLRDTGELYELWRELKEADTLATKVDRKEFLTHLKDFDERMTEVKKGPQLSPLSSLALKGKDLLELGFKPGPLIGVILRQLHEEVLDTPELNTYEQLKNRVLAKHQP